MPRTRPQDIADSNYRKIYERLAGLTYPCVLVVYGAERTHRTTHRGEHESAFAIRECASQDEAWECVDCGWAGWPPDLEIYVVGSNGQGLDRLRI